MIARRVVKALSRLTDPLLTSGEGITFLIYHRVGGGTASEVDLPVDDFRAQVEYLAEHFDVMSIDDAARELQSQSVPASTRRQVVITVDDGTADFVDHVVPALVEANVPAVLYAATHFIDTATDFPWGAPPTSWSALRDATSTGLVTVGSHTHSHWLMDRTDVATVATDLDRSIELITTHLGITPRHFAYPKAVVGSAATEAAVRERFDSAALARNKVNHPGRADLHRLWRTPVQRSDSPRHFAAKAAGGMRLEGALRDSMARWTYRGQTQ
ncbi:MAG: polysaccharide deacetylase family protein [Ilumatobacteraceae bacterium]